MDEPLLCIRNLKISFHRRDVAPFEAVRGVDLDIYAGETLGLVGASGSGKSLTAHGIMRLLPPFPGCRIAGSIHFQKEDVLAMAPPAMQDLRGNRISMIFQEPMTALNPLHRVGRQIGEVIRVHGGPQPKARLRQRVLELLEQVGIPEPERRMDAWPHELSGGQRQRVMIAMAIANRPDLLIADEPTTALDVTVQAQILELLSRLQKEMGMAMLLITHDLGVVRHVTSRMAVMEEGQIVETGETAKIFAEGGQAPCTKALLQAEKFTPPAPAEEDAPSVLETRSLGVRFPLKTGLFRKKRCFDAVSGASFCLRRGQTLGVVGESGSGKTSLGLAVLRLLQSEGEVFLNGKPLHGLSQKALRPLRRRFQVVFQDPFASLSPRMAVGDIVAEGLVVHGMGDVRQREERVVRALEEVGLNPEVRFRYPHEFSGGQRQRIAIARALVLDPEVLVLDEPTSSLDRAVQFQVLELLRSLQESRGLAYLFISHDLKVIRAISHHVLVMKDGHIVESGEAAVIFDQPEQSYTRRLLSAALA
ncbi:microcin C transport system ATP-binding protein [Desulfobotulus alkaliphilus]|uniref:Microcin C transport system ATP-binding protein n=1 Tax=Desulfobotulus alkaliphilus TaxID=622671 RepID=A0A562S877_9BACT|nr:ABC transporter ATP-binding protein [Desulfobotulus alkaliphilus]TWI76924.1 microcin C transport system ATP-binding protein [Desulfobotulus alkaliphilus]